jgi:HPt (histidine-containing phosphotransfer) domain-containing protein
MKGDRERCLAAGMDGYLSKPLRPAELFEAIERLGAPPSEAEIFLDQSEQLIARLEEAVARGDAREIGKAAHKLKGSASVFRAERAARAAGRIEEMARAGELAAIAAAQAELVREVGRLRAALEKLMSPRGAESP